MVIRQGRRAKDLLKKEAAGSINVLVTLMGVERLKEY